MLASARRAVQHDTALLEFAGRGGEEVDGLLLPVRLVQPDPAAAGRPVQRGASGAAELGDGGRRQRHADGAARVHRYAELRGQSAGEFAGGRHGEGHMGADTAQELLFGAEDGYVRRALDLHRGQVERRRVGTAAVGKRHPEVTAAEHLDEPAARLGAAERGPEHLFELIGRPSALRMGLDLCRNVHCFPFSPHALAAEQ